MRNINIVDSLYEYGKYNQIPIHGDFELTADCNLSCDFCYVHDNNEKSKKHFIIEKWFRIIKESSELGMLFATFTGGEIFTISNFRDIYCQTYDLGVRIMLLTNGLLIDDEVCKYLAARKPLGISITAYGKDNLEYLQTTKCENGFDKLVKAIELLKRYNLPVSLKANALPGIIGSLPALSDFSKKMGIPFTVTKYISPKRNGSGNCKYRLEPEEICKYTQLIEIGNEDRSRMPKNRQCSIARCNAGKGRFAISSTMQLMGCLCFPKIVEDVEKQTFECSLKKLRTKLSAYDSVCIECENCSAQKTCSQCGGVNFFETGSPYLCSDYRKKLALYELL